MDYTTVVVAGIAVVMPAVYAWRDAVKARAVALERIEDRKVAAAAAKAIADAAEAAAERGKVTAQAALDAADKLSNELATQNSAVSTQLATIHAMVNSQLTEAVERWRAAVAMVEQMTSERLVEAERLTTVTRLYEEMRALLLEKVPSDPRVQALVLPHTATPAPADPAEG